MDGRWRTMKREYDFSKAKRGPLKNLPPLSEIDRHTKVRITIMLDLDLLKFFKSRAGKRGEQPYQTQINQALREYIAAHSPDPGGAAGPHDAFISRLAERVAAYTVKRAKTRRRSSRS